MRAEDFLRFASVDGSVSKDDALEAVRMARKESADYNTVVQKWSMWCFNHITPFETVICQIWGGTLSGFGGRYYCRDNDFTQHIIETWQKLEYRRDARMLYFYCELDTENRKKLVDWIMYNYAG